MAVVTQEKVQKKLKRHVRAKKKKEGPKMPLTAFFFYMGSRRADLIVEKPELKTRAKEIGKIIGEEWKAMSEQDKQVYIDKAAEDKERYRRELAAFKASGAEAIKTASSETTADEEKKSSDDDTVNEKQDESN